MYVYKTRNPESNFNFSNATSFEVFESISTQSTTNTIYQLKLNATTQSEVPGKYIIQWFVELANSTNNNTTLFKVSWKPTTSPTWITLAENDIFSGRSEVYEPSTGFRVVDLIVEDTIDIKIEWARGDGGTARIRNANLYVFRVEIS